MSYEDFYGYRLERLQICGKNAIIVYPKEGTSNGRWILKTEYFGAFPEAELELVKLGYHIAHIETVTRWYMPEDNEAKLNLVKYMHESLGLSEKCVIVGMSCGGMQGIYFGAEYGEYVSCMYFDAPVVNFLSCPCGYGNFRHNKDFEPMRNQFFEYKGITADEILTFNDQPFMRIPALLERKIPLLLISGDSDTVVPFEENGLMLKEAYERAGVTIETHLKKGGDHHPHGLDDTSVIVNFVLKYDK